MYTKAYLSIKSSAWIDLLQINLLRINCSSERYDFYHSARHKANMLKQVHLIWQCPTPHFCRHVDAPEVRSSDVTHARMSRARRNGC